MLDPTLDVRGNVEIAVAPIRAHLTRFDEINARLAEGPDADEMDALLEEQARVQDAIEAAEGWDLDRRVEIAMDAMRLPPGDAQVSTLSGGERRRVALCKILLERPDLLLLDEPTNHLDAESVAWLERHLQEYPGTVVLVTHDRYFLDNVAQWILELDRGQGIPWEGNYSSWLEQKQARLALEEKQESSRRKQLARELEWVRMSPRARVAKNRARLQRYEQLASQDADRRDEAIVLQIPPGPHLGTLVVEAQDLSKAYGDNLLFEGMSFRLPPGGIVGVIGPNGAGKTTLFRMIVGQETPDSGILRMGDSVVFSYVDQNRDALAADNTVFQEITGGYDPIVLGKRKVPARAYVAQFNFKGPDQEKKVGLLSGGERNRVHLAKLLKSGGNLLAPGRADQRPRRRDAAGTRRGPARFRRLRRRDQPRPLVSRPDRHPHPGLRGRKPGRLVRRQLPDLRSPAQGATGHRRRPAAPDPLQVAGRWCVISDRRVASSRLWLGA